MSRDISMPLAFDEIEVPQGRRPVDPAAVKRLADSIEEIGLKHPITVRRKGDNYILVAGLHRLEACRKLGREHVPAIICTMTNAEARMWEIAENLHRADLTKQERADQIAEWVKLREENKPREPRAVSGGRGNEGGVRAASRELNEPATNVRQAVKIASITPEAKEAAREQGLDDNQSALLKVAAAPPECQVATVHQLRAAKDASKFPKDEHERAVEWRRSFERLWNGAPSETERQWAREWIDAPIMDRRHS